jgi:uncharacterized membrane protein
MLNTPDFTKDFDDNEVTQYKWQAILAYVPPLFFIALCATNGSKYGRFHANQGLLLTIVYFAVSAVVGFLSFVFSLIGLEILGGLFTILEVVPVLLMVFGIVKTCKRNSVELPIIGKFRIFK